MANEGLSVPARYGQDLGSGAEEALFLKVFGGEVLTAFERFAVTNGRVRERRIVSGKSAQFPLVGAMSAGFHTPGQNIVQEGAGATYLSDPKVSEKIISIDGILQSSVLISDIDDAMAHYDVRGPFAREMGWALAKEFDIHTMQTIIVGAQTSATISGDASDWGSTADKTIFNATFTSGSASNALTSIETIGRQMDEDDVPEEGRHIAVEPRIYRTIARDVTTYASRDFENDRSGASVVTSGAAPVLHLEGFMIHKSNRIKDVRALGSSDYTVASEQLGTDYSSDHFNHTLGVAWQQDWAVGVVRLLELGMASDYLLQYLATLLVGGFSVGHGVLHESACYVVRDADV